MDITSLSSEKIIEIVTKILDAHESDPTTKGHVLSSLETTFRGKEKELFDRIVREYHVNDIEVEQYLEIEDFEAYDDCEDSLILSEDDFLPSSPRASLMVAPPEFKRGLATMRPTGKEDDPFDFESLDKDVPTTPTGPQDDFENVEASDDDPLQELEQPEEEFIMLSDEDLDALDNLGTQLCDRSLISNESVKEVAHSLLIGLVNIVGVTSQTNWASPGLSATRGTAYVLGRTGAGKSTLLAHLIGHPLKKKSYQGLPVYDYVEVPTIAHPVIGHQTSQTKGCRKFTGNLKSVSNSGGVDSFAELDFVDCAGTMDRGGPDQDICNAVALSIAMTARPPTSILAVIRFSDIMDDNGGQFLQLLKLLSRCVRSDEFETAWRGFLFVVNTAGKIQDAAGEVIVNVHGYLLQQLHYICQSETADLKGLDATYFPDLSSQELREFREGRAPAGGAAQTFLAELPKEITEKYDELQFNIRFLSWLCAHGDHLCVANIRDSRTRCIISHHLLDRSRILQPYSFMPEHLFGDTTKDPRGAVDEVINGTVILVCDKISQLENKLETVKALLLERAVLRKLIDGYAGAPAPKATDKSKLAKDLVKQIGNLDKEIDLLKTDTEEIIFYSIFNPEVVARRPFGLVSPTAYDFEFTTPKRLLEPDFNVPILRVDEIPGTKHLGAKAGTFSFNQLNKSAGKYSSQYVPAYYGYREDKDTVVNVYVEYRYHPATEALILDKNRTKRRLIKELKELDSKSEAETSSTPDAAVLARLEATVRDLSGRISASSELVSAFLTELYSFRKVCVNMISIMAHLRSGPSAVAESASRREVNVKFVQFMTQLKCPGPGVAKAAAKAAGGGAAEDAGDAAGDAPGAAFAPLFCREGHPMWADRTVSIGTDAAATPNQWRCSQCSTVTSGERWVCVQCETNLCFACHMPVVD